MREHPAQVGQHLAQELFRIEDGNLDVEDVRQRLQDLGAAALLAAVEKLLARLRRFVLHQAGGQKLLAEMLQILQRQTIRAKAVLEVLLRLVEGVRAIHQLEKEILLLLEAVIAQADRVLDDVVGAAFVFLRRDAQVAAHAQTHELAAF